MSASPPVIALPALPWYRSPVMIGSVATIVSSLVVVLPKLGAALGLTDPAAINTSVNALFEMFALGSGIYTAIARKNSAIQPVTLTAAAAAVHPATLMANKLAAPEEIPFHPVPNQPWSIDMHASAPGNPGTPSNPNNPNPGKPGNPNPSPPKSVG